MNKSLKGGMMVGTIALVALVVDLYAGYVGIVEKTLGMESYEVHNNASDVFGSKTVTTTVGQAFSTNAGSPGQSATSSAIKKLGENISQATFTIMPTLVSSTANLAWEIQGSQDFGCDTTATSTTDTSIDNGDFPLISEINWFSVGDNSPNKAQTTSFTNSSSTISYLWTNPMANVGQTVILENLNFECLRLNMSGSSTEAWVQIATK